MTVDAGPRMRVAAGDGPLRRVARDTALAVVVAAAGLLVWRPSEPRLAAGVIGGGALIGLAWWAIGGLVRTAIRAAESGENRRISGASALVKFFTRHAILALVAYGMMARLELHPVGLLVGVSTILVGATMEATRGQMQRSKFNVSGSKCKFTVRERVKSGGK